MFGDVRFINIFARLTPNIQMRSVVVTHQAAVACHILQNFRRPISRKQLNNTKLQLQQQHMIIPRRRLNVTIVQVNLRQNYVTLNKNVYNGMEHVSVTPRDWNLFSKKRFLFPTIIILQQSMSQSQCIYTVSWKTQQNFWHLFRKTQPILIKFSNTILNKFDKSYHLTRIISTLWSLREI